MGKLYRPSLDRLAGDEYPMPPCTQVNPEIFTEYKSRKKAQEICMGCPLKKSCLRSAMRLERDPGGVYGGLTEPNRADLRKRIECQPIGN